MSRDGQGNYTPPYNDVATGDVISSTWANGTIDDISSALTDSLSRSGNGGMLASFRAVDGTVNIPAISFNNETNSGIYRAGTGEYRLCVNGKDKARIKDVDGMAAFQVFDLNGTDTWETLATASDLSSLTLADVLAAGNTTGGTDLQITSGDVIQGTAVLALRHGNASQTALQSSTGFSRIAVDEQQAALYYGSNANQSSEKLSTTNTGIDVTGTVTADGVSLGDNEKIQLGDTQDLELFHDGTNSYVQDAGDGGLILNTTSGNGVFIHSATESMGSFNTNGAVNLYYDNAEKFATTATGIDVTGTVEADEFSGTSTTAITDFVTDVSTNDNDTTVPTTAAVKSYVDTAGGNETLAQTLALGNTTGANDIEMTDGAQITSSQLNGIFLNSTTGIRVVSGTSGFFSMGQTGTNIGITNQVGIPGLPAGSLVLATGQGNPTNSAMVCNGTDVKFYDNIRLNSSSVNILSDGDIITKHDATGETALQSSGGVHRVQATETFAALYYGANSGTGSKKLETVDAGVDITGDLDVTGNVVAAGFSGTGAGANIITHFSTDGTFSSSTDTIVPTALAVKTYVDNAAFPTTTNNAADIAYTAFNTFSGKRIINTASATNTTYGLPTPASGDVGKSWVICNPTDSEITIDHDASGTANYIWIMDGVTLSAAASSWTIKKGAIVEIVAVASDSGGGSATAPNYLIFGAGLLEII